MMWKGDVPVIFVGGTYSRDGTHLDSRSFSLALSRLADQWTATGKSYNGNNCQPCDTSGSEWS